MTNPFVPSITAKGSLDWGREALGRVVNVIRIDGAGHAGSGAIDVIAQSNGSTATQNEHCTQGDSNPGSGTHDDESIRLSRNTQAWRCVYWGRLSENSHK